MSKITQNKKMLEHLRAFGPITTLEAILNLHIVRPASRIHDLRELGYVIDTEIIYEEHEDGSKTHYAKYTLIGDLI